MPKPSFKRYPKPRYVAIEMTDQCNLRCTMCERLGNLEPLNREGGFMEMALFDKVAAYLEPDMTVGLGGFGEAFMHPAYPEMLARVKAIGCKTVTYSNGLLMDEPLAEAFVRHGMDELSISTDGGTEGTYREIRKADFNRLLAGVELLATTRARLGATLPKITLQMVGMVDNVHEVPDLVRTAKQAGADAVTVINLSCHMPELKEKSLFLYPDLWQKHFAQAQAEAAALGVELTLPEMESGQFSCGGFFKDMFVTWDGLIQPCGLERYILGDVSADSIDAVWNGAAYEHYRARWETEGPTAVCKNCHRLTNDKEAWINPPQPTYPVRLTYRQTQSSSV